MENSFPAKKYNVIYADPPWHYRVWSKKGESRSAASYYDVMGTEEISNLPIQSICEKDCALFLWATYPNLRDALAVMDKWGFEYKTVAFTWVKVNRKGNYHYGMGYWTRANPEIVLLGTRGKIKRVYSGVPNLVITEVKDHSRKPVEVRDLIVKLMGDVPRIELFARDRFPGWDAWGNELV